MTARLDFGLLLVSMLRDRAYAESLQLLAAENATASAEKIAAAWPM